MPANVVELDPSAAPPVQPPGAEYDRLAQIVEASPTLIYVFNQVEQANEYSNRDIGEMLGYSAEEVQAMGAELMTRLIHPDDLGRVFENFGKIKALADGEVATIEYRARHRAGHWVWLLSRDMVFKRAINGQVTHHIGAAIDISAQKEAEERARASEARQIATNQELRDFAYAISHDMKAPSNTMELLLSEMAQMLDDGDIDEARSLIKDGQTVLLGMRKLIDDVLEHTRVIGQETELGIVDLNAVLHLVVSHLRADIAATGGQIRVGDMPSVRGSETQLMILLQNLLQNALKFSKDGVPPIVEVTATPVAGGDQACLSVKDNGIGIAQDRQKQIFHLFKKLNGAGAHQGSGIGLATCRRIALNHGSEISLSSTPGVGSVFSVNLVTV